MSNQSSFEFPFNAFQEKYHANESQEMDQSMLIEKFSQQVNILQTELSEKEQLLSKRDEEYAKLEKQFETCEGKRRKLTEQLDLAMVKFDELTEDFNRQAAAPDSGSVMKSEIESLQSRLEEKARENARFQQSIHRLNQDKESLEATISAMQNSQGEMTSVFDEYKSQKNTFANIMHQKTLEIEDYRLQVDRLKTENAELNRQVKQSRENLGQKTVSTEGLRDELEINLITIAKLTERNTKLEEAKIVSDQKLSGIESTLSQTQTDNEWLKTQLEDKTSQYESLLLKLQSQEATNQTSELSKLALGESNMDLKHRLVQLETERDELRSQIERSKSTLQQVQSSNIEGEASRSSQMQKIEELKERIAALEAQIVTLENEAKVKDSDLLNCANLIQEHKGNILRLEVQVKDMQDREEQFQKLRTEHLQLEMEHRTLKRDLERSSQQLQHSSKRYESRDETIEKLRKENETLNSANVNFNQKMVQISSQIDSLTADRNHFRKLFKESEIELDELRRESERATISKLEAESGMKTCQTRIESLEKEVAHFQSLERTRLVSLTEGLERSKRAEGEKQNLVREMTILIEEKTKFLNRSKMLEGELRKLEDIKHHITLELENTKGTVAEQSVILQEKDSNYVKLDSVCKCQEQENKTLRGQLRQFEQQQELYHKEARGVNEEMKDLRLKLKNTTEKANKYQISLKEELLRRESTQDELMRCQEELNRIRRDCNLMTQNRAEYQAVIQERTLAVGKLNEEIRRRDRSIQQLENSHKDITRKFNELVESYKHLQSSYREKDGEVAAQMNEILRLRSQVEAFIQDNGNLTSDLEKRKQILLQAANDVRSIQTDREVLRNQLIRRGEESGRISKALDIKIKENEKLITKNVHMKKQTEELKKGYDLLKRKYEEAKNESANYRFQLERAGSKMKKAYEAHGMYKKHIKDMTSRLNSKSTALEASGQRLKEALCRESSMRSELKHLREKLIRRTSQKSSPHVSQEQFSL